MTGSAQSDRLTTIARSLDATAFPAIATAVLGGAVQSLVDAPDVAPLSAHHYDSRTVGMLHVTGQAVDAAGQVAAWSCVIKVLDFGQPPRPNSFFDAANEVHVYRDRLFAADGDAFRPARCYLVGDGPGGTTLLWLEDLTGMQKPPFTIEELGSMSAHLGAWNARLIASPPALSFTPRTNSFLPRLERSPDFLQTTRLRDFQDHRYVRDAYRDLPIETFDRFLALVHRLNRKTAQLTPALCFGDCNVGNLFSGANETVAVDWASLTFDPPGVDVGCLVGSAICWGRGGAAVAVEERDLFETYLASLAAAGPTPPRSELRCAYFALYNFYVCFCATMPALLLDEVFPVPLVELRFGAPADDIPHLVSGVIARLPDYIAELEQLVA